MEGLARLIQLVNGQSSSPTHNGVAFSFTRLHLLCTCVYLCVHLSPSVSMHFHISSGVAMCLHALPMQTYSFVSVYACGTCSCVYVCLYVYIMLTHACRCTL